MKTTEQKKNGISSGQAPPSIPGLPFIGNTHQLIRNDTLPFFTDCVREHGDVVELQMGRTQAYLVGHPDLVEHVLVANNGNYVKAGFQKKAAGDLFGDGLIQDDGESWRQQRRLLEDAFHPDYVERYARIIQDRTEAVVQKWSDGDVVDMREEMQRLALGVIAEALFDVDIDAGGRADEFVEAFSDILDYFTHVCNVYIDIPAWLPTGTNKRYRRALSTLDDFIYDLLDERRSEPGETRDLVDLLLDAQADDPDGITDEDIRNEIFTFLFAGHETTTLAMTYTFYLLSQSPEWAESVVDEATALDPDGDIGFADLSELTTLEKVLNESMRLYPPVYGVFREPVDDDVIGGYRVPSGSMVVLSQWVIHRDPRFYDDPETFAPERWTESFERDLHDLAYFPFGAGPRRCIGERLAKVEAKTVLSRLLTEYSVELESTNDLSVTPTLTTHPSNPIRLRISSR